MPSSIFIYSISEAKTSIERLIKYILFKNGEPISSNNLKDFKKNNSKNGKQYIKIIEEFTKQEVTLASLRSIIKSYLDRCEPSLSETKLANKCIELLKKSDIKQKQLNFHILNSNSKTSLNSLCMDSQFR